MSVPLDNLYHWVEGLLPSPAIVYVFRPHGSKKISDLDWLYEYDQKTCWQLPSVIVHDQEPLYWDLYNNPQQYMAMDKWRRRWRAWENSPVYWSRLQYCARFNLNSIVYSRGTHYDKSILIHSEKNSPDLTQYQHNDFVGVYWWSHAMIARDWYRFAQHDVRLLDQCSQPRKFLIYCRDWSHSREYRLKFMELLVSHGLDGDSQTSIMHENSDQVHFSQHQFHNRQFDLVQPQLISTIPVNQCSSAESADYNPTDFVNTQISLVLETVFDGTRIHLTEKTLRPIACGHPFLLAAGPGSLAYLKSYGFQTFAPWIDESYDYEPNSLQRLIKIVQAMKSIQSLQGPELEEFCRQTQAVAQFNKAHFFSHEFADKIQQELQSNLEEAFDQIKHSQGKHYLEFLKLVKKHGLIHQVAQRQEKTLFVRQLRQSCQGGQSTPLTNPPA